MPQKPDLSISNAIEQTQRAQIFNRSLTAEKTEGLKAPLKKTSPAPKPAAKTEIAAAEKPVSSLQKVKDLYRSSTTRGGSRTADAESMSAAAAPRSPSAAAAPVTVLAEAPAPAQRQSLPALAGDLKPVWADSELLLVRQARLEGVQRLQGVWLDWPQLRTSLIDTVRDLLPEAQLIPVSPLTASTDATALVTLPVKLVTGRVPISALDFGSALRPALIIAWSCLIVAALAIAFVLHRAMLLSERRGAFVSAVTHELRTPLTTFRLYSEMLADDMVPEPQQRKEYLTTLCDESTRLMHLVGKRPLLLPHRAWPHCRTSGNGAHGRSPPPHRAPPAPASRHVQPNFESGDRPRRCRRPGAGRCPRRGADPLQSHRQRLQIRRP
jgi:hypothetical protein